MVGVGLEVCVAVGAGRSVAEAVRVADGFTAVGDRSGMALGLDCAGKGSVGVLVL